MVASGRQDAEHKDVKAARIFIKNTSNKGRKLNGQENRQPRTPFTREDCKYSQTWMQHCCKQVMAWQAETNAAKKEKKLTKERKTSSKTSSRRKPKKTATKTTTKVATKTTTKAATKKPIRIDTDSSEESSSSAPSVDLQSP